MTTLDQLPIGITAVVETIAGDDELSIRLMEMGLVPGTECTMLGAAPWGDPLEISVRGYRLSVRRSEARRIEIQLS